MDIEYKGANCITLSTKQATVAVDPNVALVGLKNPTGKMTVQVATQEEFAVEPEAGVLKVSGPGEYELEAGVSIVGIAAQRHIDTTNDGKKATVYRVEIGDISVAVVGHITGQLSGTQLEALGVIDVLVVPVGNSGYTLDAHEAIAIVRQVDPKVIIPTHYADDAAKYEVPQAELEPFLKELGATHETVAKLKLKAGQLPETLTVYEITRTS
ncbi:Zn-dependent hydrolase [Candidatus Saccharibacteria bacterium]|nr:MAG: Zn-dependent hydrolase [Candidatus Saccharibacteria bacterium]